MKLSKKYLCCFLAAMVFCVIVSGGCGGSSGGDLSGGNDTTNETPNENETPNTPTNPENPNEGENAALWYVESASIGSSTYEFYMSSPSSFDITFSKNADDEYYSDDEADQDILFKTQYDFACERLVTEEDLVGLDKDDLRIMRNWIFASHGYIFTSQDLKDYFEMLPWYNPRYTDVSSMLSNIEKKNIEFIKRYE